MILQKIIWTSRRGQWARSQTKIDKLGRAYATGRRKTSVSRVWIKYGNKKITVNGKASDKYFKGKYIIQFSKNPYLKLKI